MPTSGSVMSASGSYKNPVLGCSPSYVVVRKQKIFLHQISDRNLRIEQAISIGLSEDFLLDHADTRI
jgi:hypothetical protein